ncbi:hypothetical protein KYC5002_12515 [Archangium violaceum]|uniref:hypothetical protein n=1 Tax=Archangium violaceum TaxID=83451 RepID=UPI002B30BDE5|nr:hypothetical protein KYC5002_12515 [Archangium gephyra]
MRLEDEELSLSHLSLRYIVQGLIAALVLLAPAVGSALTRQGIDLNTYCRTQYGSSAYAVLLQNNAYGWACRLGTQNLGAQRQLHLPINDNYTSPS